MVLLIDFPKHKRKLREWQYIVLIIGISSLRLREMLDSFTSLEVWMPYSSSLTSLWVTLSNPFVMIPENLLTFALNLFFSKELESI